jgi:hypothetical protein
MRRFCLLETTSRSKSEICSFAVGSNLSKGNSLADHTTSHTAQFKITDLIKRKPKQSESGRGTVKIEIL